MTATSTLETGDDERDAANGLGLPFAWEHGPHGPARGHGDRMFRFPVADDPGPGPRRLLVMSIYTALLGLLSLAVTLRAVFAFASDTAPGWYAATFATVGFVGFGCVVGGFLSIHRRYLPWVLLALAAVPLAVNVIATVTAT
jgi:hypothetical protein